MFKAFFSHSSDDKDIVRTIKKRVGRVWTYFDEDCFEPGEDFRSAISTRLADTNLFVLFVSKSSLRSSWVKFEIDETYWQTISRDNISILALTLDDIDVSQLPAWMRKAKFESVKSPYLAASIIKKKLFENSSIQNHTYIGRENDTVKFYNDIAELESSFPNVIVITGLTGVGRRTFIKDILSKRFSLELSVEFRLYDADGLVELYRKLLDDNIQALKPAEIEEYNSWFLSHAQNERAAEAARVLALYSQHNVCPFIVDEGAMIDDDGYYRSDFITTLRDFSENFPDCYLVLINTRIPKFKPQDRNLAYVFRLQALDPNSCYSLFDSLLVKNNVPIPDISQVKDISKYLEGYPPSAIFATRECILEGVDAVCHDKTSLIDFQSQLFSKYIDKISLSENDMSILTAIHNIGELSIQMLSAILPLDDEIITSSLKNCLEYSVIDLNQNGFYTISPPMRMTINRIVPDYDKNEFSRIANVLIKDFWNHEGDDITFSIIDIIINTILRSGQEEDLVKFQKYVLPSHLLKAAEKANQDTDWALAEKYARKAILLDNNLNKARALLFKVLVRQETPKSVSVNNKQENEILDVLRKEGDIQIYYLEGFRNWKRRKYYDAIDCFVLAKEAGDDSIPTHRDLAECYYQTNQIDRAQHEIESIIKPKSRKISNPFLLDLASKIAIELGNFEYADELLEKQALVDRMENVAHRRATYYVKKQDYETALSYSEKACQGIRVLPQMHLLRMNIGIHLKRYDIVEKEYKYIKDTYKHYSVDTCEIIYTTMLLNKKGWKFAEASYSKIRNPENPFARNLRGKIIGEKLRDPCVAQIEKEKLLKEKLNLENKRALDVLGQFQCYDIQ